MKNIILLLAIGLIAMNAEARDIHYGDNNYYEINRRYFSRDLSDCVNEYITKIGEKDSIAQACTQTEALELSWKTQVYPNLKENPRRVQYWAGSYGKVVATTSTYLRELVDSCRGRIISKMTVSEVDKSTEIYKIVNANLDPSIKESFMLVPLTEAEAKQELAEAQKRCLAK